MEPLRFKPIVPGMRILWVIQFSDKISPRSERQFIDFFIPSPFHPNEWIKTDTQINQQTLTLLQKINEAYNQIKIDCLDADIMGTLRQYIQKAQGIFGPLEDLEALMKNFDDLMKRLSRPPSQESEPDEGKSD